MNIGEKIATIELPVEVFKGKEDGYILRYRRRDGNYNEEWISHIEFRAILTEKEAKKKDYYQQAKEASERREAEIRQEYRKYD